MKVCIQPCRYCFTFGISNMIYATNLKISCASELHLHVGIVGLQDDSTYIWIAFMRVCRLSFYVSILPKYTKGFCLIWKVKLRNYNKIKEPITLGIVQPHQRDQRERIWVRLYYKGEANSKILAEKHQSNVTEHYQFSLDGIHMYVNYLILDWIVN